MPAVLERPTYELPSPPPQRDDDNGMARNPSQEDAMPTTPTTGRDLRGTSAEGVLIRTLDDQGDPLPQDQHVTLGFRNYGAAITEANRLRAESRDRGHRGWWLAFEADGAAFHLESQGLPVSDELDRLARTVTVAGL